MSSVQRTEAVTASTARLSGLTRSFGETQALNGLDLEISSGAVLGIAGPNGSGKSTLMRILGGEDALDSGTVTINGELVSRGLLAHMVAVVHQEPQIWPNLTIAQNLLVGREHSRYRLPAISAGEAMILADLGIATEGDREAGSCSLAVRQRTEIARAIARDASIVLFDEPNSALSEEESVALFRHMDSLVARGRLVVLVSHRLGDLVAHCGRVAVVRNGRVVTVLSGSLLSEEAIARELVVGHAHVQRSTQAAGGSSHRRDIMSVEGWTHIGGAFRDVSFAVGSGEILAIVGVEGSGARELVQSIASDVKARGRRSIFDERGQATSVRRVAYLCADRRDMLFGNLSVGGNLTIRLGIPEIAFLGGLLSLRRQRALAQKLLRRFGVRARTPLQPLPSLSGGNQQKVAIAAAIAREPMLLVLEEPTRGVDVGSKAEIYDILRTFTSSGVAAILYCTELPEAFEVADRLLVVDRGVVRTALDVHAFADVTALAETVATTERIRA